MTEFNTRTTLNHQLQLDAEAVECRASKAKARQFARKLNKAYRQSVTTVAVDATLIGAILASSVILLTCMVG